MILFIVIDKYIAHRSVELQRPKKSSYAKYLSFEMLTLPAVVAAVRHGFSPSYFPIVTRLVWILWPSFNVKIGTSILVNHQASITSQDRSCL